MKSMQRSSRALRSKANQCAAQVSTSFSNIILRHFILSLVLWIEGYIRDKHVPVTNSESSLTVKHTYTLRLPPEKVQGLSPSPMDGMESVIPNNLELRATLT